jgi:hypothetical protein
LRTTDPGSDLNLLVVPTTDQLMLVTFAVLKSWARLRSTAWKWLATDLLSRHIQNDVEYLEADGNSIVDLEVV